jgi:two-component system repressor protein LuxO
MVFAAASLPPVLIVEDSPALAQTYTAFLAEAGYTARIASTAREAAVLVARGGFCLVLLDLVLPDGDGLALLGAWRRDGIAVPVVVVTANAGAEHAVAALRAGAEDYIVKPVQAARLALTVRHVAEKQALKTLVGELSAGARDGYGGFTGRAPAMQGVYRLLAHAAQSTAPVLLTGESGTGKELAARAIHDMGPRGGGPLETVNCAALPRDLLESEMFGHARGAFTGAVSAYAGAAARADGGTLFLDEMTEMPPDMQAKLLRFTQSGAFRPLGGAREEKSDVRFISATNRDPEQAVRAGQLREDLYYRLNVIEIRLPPLRARDGDVLLLAEKFMRDFARADGKHFSTIAEDACDWLRRQSWPGNVRQLQNAVRRAVALHDGDALTAAMLADMPPVMTGGEEKLLPPPAPDRPPTLAEIEKRTIAEALASCGGNIAAAARQLDVDPSTLHRKLRRWKGGGPV